MPGAVVFPDPNLPFPVYCWLITTTAGAVAFACQDLEAGPRIYGCWGMPVRAYEMRRFNRGIEKNTVFPRLANELKILTADFGGCQG